MFSLKFPSFDSCFGVLVLLYGQELEKLKNKALERAKKHEEKLIKQGFTQGRVPTLKIKEFALVSSVSTPTRKLPTPS
jgi:hypothetical protein